MGERRISNGLRLAWCLTRSLARAGLAYPRRFLRRARWRFLPRFTRLDLAPEDLRPAQAGIADDILDGIFDLAGVAVDCKGRSPFAILPPSADWERELHAFAWLRHLTLADPEIAPERIRVLVAEWLRYGAGRPLADETATIIRRLGSFLHEAPLLFQGASAQQHDRILAAMEMDARRLYERMGESRPGAERITHLAILAQTLLAVSDRPERAQPVLRRLDRELARFVLDDGVPADRNPATLVTLLTDLLPLRQLLAERGFAASSVLMNGLDRMLPMLRFFRHADGALALFNGAGPVSPDLMAAIFLLDDARARPPGQAPYGGYQRLEAGRTIALIDTGPAPPLDLSQAAHAAPLALEFSSGHNRFVVSTGAARDPRPDWRRAVRETAAHSTLVIGDRTPARFLDPGFLQRHLGPVMVSPGWTVAVTRQENQGILAITASHDAYGPRFGLAHERTVRLSATGDRLDGRDRVVPTGPRRDGPVALTLRFHAHPDIRLTRLSNGVIQLIAPDGEAWEFHVKAARAEIEPSVFLADPVGPRTSDQIAVHAEGAGEIRWLFLRTAEARTLRRHPLAGLLGPDETRV